MAGRQQQAGSQPPHLVSLRERDRGWLMLPAGWCWGWALQLALHRRPQGWRPAPRWEARCGKRGGAQAGRIKST